MSVHLFILFLLLSRFGFAFYSMENEEVWIKANTIDAAYERAEGSTLYFEKWSARTSQTLKDGSYYVALQLDITFDPLPNDQVSLPKLQALAAIDDDELIGNYFDFLKNLARTAGIHHLVLPDTTAVGMREKRVLQQANRHSPYFFIHKRALSDQLPSSKKAYHEELADGPDIWVTGSTTNLRKLQKWSEKRSEKERSFFLRELRKAKEEGFIPYTKMPVEMARTLFKNSTVLIDANDRLPLRTQHLTYLGTDQELVQWLSRYAEVLTHRVRGIPCIVDNRQRPIEIQKGDLVLTSDLSSEGLSLHIPGMDFPHKAMIISQMLFGACDIYGVSTHTDNRLLSSRHYLGYANAGWAKMEASKLKKIDSLARQAIVEYATPGIQVSVLKDGQVVFEKSYGYYTYDSLKQVTKNTVYDIASVTKVAATLPAIALLLDQGKIKLDDPIGQHLPFFLGSNKSSITIRQLLAHNGGLRPYVPFWSMILGGDRLDPFYYKTIQDEKNDVRSYGLQPHPGMRDSLQSFIARSKLLNNLGEYTYSDLGFMMLHLLVEQVAHVSFDEFLTQNFYEPMGLINTGFNPSRRGVSLAQIAPTEYDLRYRNYQVWGEVHDRNALVFGGVAGHAGLFSNATDLAKIMYMFMNNGYFGGRQYLSKSSIDQFNRRYFENNRRGLGWDKKDRNRDAASIYASDDSFGHTGFTGTMVWADPATKLVYVFLSNRIYPNAENWKLGKLNTRTRVHDALYQAIGRTD